ncbi:unnamed protein product, partial [Musa acuminata subsp. burmannicoides]
NKASSIIVLIFYYFYHGIRAACLEQALFSLPIHHWCCSSALPHLSSRCSYFPSSSVTAS